MNGKAFVDTNVLVYLFDGDAPKKQQRVREVLETEGNGVPPEGGRKGIQSPSISLRPISSAIGALPASTTRANASGILSSDPSTRIAATTS
jgi:hypothetical protein